MAPGHAPRRPRMGTVCAFHSGPFFHLGQGFSPSAPAVLRLERGAIECPAWELLSSASPAGKGHELHRGLREKVLTLRSDFEERTADNCGTVRFLSARIRKSGTVRGQPANQPCGYT
jgi:hypothetical protein